MGIAYHNLYAADGTTLNVADRAYFGTVSVTYAAAVAGAATVPVVVTWQEPIPMPYFVALSPIEDCTWFITAKTTLGCTLNVQSRLLTTTLLGGTTEMLIIS